MTSFEERTKQLRSIIRRSKNSAQEVWNAGEILLGIKANDEYKRYGYDSFNDYTMIAFRIEEPTANKYIEVFQKIPLDIVQNSKVTPLYTLIEMEESLRNDLMAAMSLIKPSNPQEKYTEKIIFTAKRLLESAQGKLSKQDITQLLQLADKWDKQDRKRIVKVKLPFEMGQPLSAKAFPELEKLYASDPIDEQGFVGLFSSMFFLLRGRIFEYQGYMMSFSKILYLRNRFPDAQIEFKIHDKKNIDNSYSRTQLNVEFEFKSRNYFTHEHHKSKEVCHMIICWEDNFQDKRFERPPTLSVKDLITSGEIKFKIYSPNILPIQQFNLW